MVKRVFSFDIPKSILDRNNIINTNWNKTFDKLRVFDLIEYDKIMYLDCDMLVVDNIDFLFEYPSVSANWAGKSVPNNEFGTFNSGCMVIEPKDGMSDEIFSLLEEAFSGVKGGFGDQDLIKYYLKDWEKHSELHIPEGCGVFAVCLDYYIKKLGYTIAKKNKREKDVKIIHFIGPDKPWMKTKKQALWFLLNRIKYNQPRHAIWFAYYLWMIR